MEQITKKNYDAIDLLKFILSIMVVAIHTRFLKEYTFPWLRLAVPLFFIISAYFFFKKIKDKSADIQKSALWNFTKRNLALYLFYFILFLPVTLYLKREVIARGIGYTVLIFLRDFLLGGTFRASWFIIANIIGVAIIYMLSKKLGNEIILLISFIIYAAVTVSSSYMNCFSENGTAAEFLKFYIKTFCEPYNSFPAGLVWIAIGKCFADGTFNIVGRKLQIVLSIIGCVMLLGEHYIIQQVLKVSDYSDCYFALLIACPPIFALFRDMNLHLKSAKALRKLSVMIYAIHGSIIIIVRILFKPLGIYHTMWEFFVSLLFTFVLLLIILGIEKLTKLKFFKYSH